ncbi:hypothetical protein KI387_003918, partial [Taxus chinensis]
CIKWIYGCRKFTETHAWDVENCAALGATTLDEYRKYIEKDPAFRTPFSSKSMLVNHQWRIQSLYFVVCARDMSCIMESEYLTVPLWRQQYFPTVMSVTVSYLIK